MKKGRKIEKLDFYNLAPSLRKVVTNARTHNGIVLLLVSKDSLNGINNIACVDSHMEEVEADRFNPIEEEFDEEAQDQYVRK